MRLGVPAGHIQSDFTDDRLGDADIDAIDPRQVDTGDAVELPAQVELRGMAAGCTASLRLSRACLRPRERRGLRGVPVRSGDFVGETLQVRFERLIAFGDPLLVGIVQVDFLLQNKQEVGLPGA
jgi:hypothetical protein